MAAGVQPLLQKQQYPFPPFQPLSEERLQEKGERCGCWRLWYVDVSVFWPHSTKMAAAAEQEVFREKEVWFCGGTEGRHASRTCQEDNP